MFAPHAQSSILEHLSTAVVLFDAQWHILYLNPMAEMLFAVSARQLDGHALGLSVRLDDQPLKPWLQQVVNHDHTVKKRSATLTLADHSQIMVDYVLNPLTDASGEILLELQQVDRQLRINRESVLLNQQIASQDLVRGLAHEIKNPLGGLRGAAQLLATELPDLALHEYTDIILQEADRLQSLVDQMLGPNNPVQRDSVNIHQVLERVRQLVLAGASDQLVFIRDYDPSIPELIGVADQLIQVVLNIVKNAVHALEGVGQIILRTRVIRNYTLRQHCHRLVVQIDIIDNGPGIAAHLADTLFLPMITSGQGMGLGLSIAQTLVAQHQGLIECHSQPGETVFSILLPMLSDSSQQR
jgi:two-component system nitrogen regulation sensor histidine kinase GlnL